MNQTVSNRIAAYGEGIWAAVWLSVVALSAFLVLPFLVGSAADELRLTAPQIGLLASADLSGCAIAACLMYLLADRLRWRTAATVALVMLGVTNILSAVTSDFAQLFAARVACGIAGGTLMAVVYLWIGNTSEPERGFGLSFGVQTAVAAGTLIALPSLITLVGSNAVFGVLALAAAAGAISLHHIPRPAMSAGPQALNARVWVALFSVLTMFAAHGAVWSLVERYGRSLELTAQSIATALAGALLVGACGGLLAARVGTSIGRVRAVLFAAAGLIAALAVLFSNTNVTGFVIAAALYQFCWNFAVGYQLSEVDPGVGTGSAIVLGLTAQSAGIGLGPAAASPLIPLLGYAGVGWFAFASITLSVGLLLLSQVFKARSEPAMT